ncbi:unnamed protein product [Phytophthora lilii]|uniref:Unnamed protein product n=1 Tax=Phytophthora lilii TaxID=2077276 RepID=A0A9W6THJ6_9STRA|nr:unnamed protein product [Phytophthora lilii]
MTRLASSISSSFMGFFGGKRGGQEETEESRRQEEAREAPLGRLIAAGQGVVNSPRHSSTISEASELSTSLQQLDDNEVSGDETEEKPDASQIEERANEAKADEPQPSAVKNVKADQESQKSLSKESEAASQKEEVVSNPKPGKVLPGDLSSSSGKEQPPLAWSMPLRAALPAPRQELVEVEGDIVEL